MENTGDGGLPDGAAALEAAGALIEAGDLGSLYGRVIDVTAGLLAADGASIQAPIPEKQQLRLVAARGLVPEAAAFWDRVDAGARSCCGQALSQGRRLFIPDVESDGRLAGTEHLRHMRLCGIRAMQMTPLFSRGGDPLGMLSTHWRRRYHPSDGLLRFLDALARQVARLIERVTAEEARRASEAGLRVRVAALERVDRDKNSFLAMLAHELRSPLAPIRNVGEVLAQVVHDRPAAHRPLAILRRQTDQLTRLVDDLLDISRIQQGRLTLQETRIEVGDLLEQALDTVQPLVREKRHHLTVRRLRSPAFVLGDGARLIQCIANLLQNAAKYTPAGGRIDVELADSGTEVSITVRDNGAGIAPSLLPHVFELFVQSEGTLEHSRGGLGIGLAIVKRVVEMHGGSVEAMSDGEGCGSAFAIRLRRMDPARAHGERDDRAAPARYKRILVVDANPDAADSVAAVLTAAGHLVEVAYSALSALAAADRLRPDAIVLDLDLPRMSGREVTRRLRAQPALRTTLVIAVSGSAGESAAARETGIDRHFSRPIDMAALKRALD